MEIRKGRCYNCREFQRYYVKGTKRFNKIKLGRCCKKDETVRACDTCDKWKMKSVGDVTWVAKHTLNNILLDISAIRQIIEERKEEYEDLSKL